MRAVVIGGGVAGSASAIALARIGADVTVYEAYQDPAGQVALVERAQADDRT